MKFIVDLDTCENHGQCTYMAPGVFTLDDSGALALRADATGAEYISDELLEEQLEDVQEAADMCPVQAIRMEG